MFKFFRRVGSKISSSTNQINNEETFRQGATFSRLDETAISTRNYTHRIAIKELEHKLLRWRDDSVASVEVYLCDKFPAFKDDILSSIRNSSFFTKQFRKRALKKQLDKQFHEWFVFHSGKLSSNAKKQLENDCKAIGWKQLSSFELDVISDKDVSMILTNLKYAIGYGAGATSLGAVLVTPKFVITSASSFFGLVGTSYVSGLKLAIILFVIVATLLICIGSNMLAEQRLKRGFVEHYKNLLFDHNRDEKSLCELIEHSFEDQYKELLNGAEQNAE